MQGFKYYEIILLILIAIIIKTSIHIDVLLIYFTSY